MAEATTGDVQNITRDAFTRLPEAEQRAFVIGVPNHVAHE